jgi:stearoyl-CoA desaturase (delta-9 desaturase)
MGGQQHVTTTTRRRHPARLLERFARPADGTQEEFRLNRANLVFVVAAHVLALGGAMLLMTTRAPWQSYALGLVWFGCCGLSITSGYHRLFAHRAYCTIWPVRLFYILFGAASMQNNVISWCADHRRHHLSTDHDNDPYNIGRGFWWAHIGWVMFDAPGDRSFKLVADLETDPLLRFQLRHYPLLAFLVGLALPTGLGAFWGDPVGSLIIAGILRVVIQWHATFSVNSLAHFLGKQPYTTRVSARDSWFVSLVTLGEGYHNFHHCFPSDYRNGVRWYQFDPTKWLIWTLCRLQLAWGLRRVPQPLIERVRTRTAGNAFASSERQ